jgi:hypothetical protein
MMSVHLEGLPRQSEFRAARERIINGCQQHTLFGQRLPEVSSDGPATVQLGLSEYLIHDGKRAFPLSIGVNSIGRLHDNAVIVADEHVSRRHCAIIVHSNGTCEIHDIASKNGTILNGVKINGPTRIRPGDTIGLCSARLVLLVQDAPSTPRS